MPGKQELQYSLPNNRGIRNVRINLFSLPLYVVNRYDLCSGQIAGENFKNIKIVLEAIKGKRQINEVAVEYEVHPNRITN